MKRILCGPARCKTCGASVYWARSYTGNRSDSLGKLPEWSAPAWLNANGTPHTCQPLALAAPYGRNDAIVDAFASGIRAEEIASLLGISRARVYQILARARA